MTPTIAPDDVLVELTPRQIAEKIAADARMRLICLKPEYDTIDMGEALIQHAITGLQDRVERQREALKPFAEKAEYADALQADDDDYIDCAPLKAGDFRKARAALIG